MLKLLFVAAVLVALWLYLRPRKPRLKDEAEARQVLGVGPDADEATIRAAHRRLIGAVHPDRGGSADLTQRVNAARDVLLGRLRH
ncbi:DnaJ domain-containing protein [Sphingomonas sp. PL-96]|uniref:J domain-containing protein n=1 Tax=Sphingomonas sp. PL-96 TaxID=2887201 RepID=UPI001E5E6BE5|nr:DnaJ domain-containing protein [Sphingomonas sp. PL-96]MCC2977377.1 DnaJ domain-containing protein [Sphingomonas sp. PL-96]